MIGFLGLGTMGTPMATNLLRAGTPVLAWSRSRRAYPVVHDEGGDTADTVEEVFRRSETVLMMLADDEAIDAVLGRGTPGFDELVHDRTVVHMGTTEPAYSQGLARDIARAGGRYVEAPVSGSRTPAEAGELIAMVAGDAQVVADLVPVLGPMVLKTIDCGQVPNALTMKLAVNLFLITQVVGLAEAFQFAVHHELDLEAFREVLDSGPMASSVSRAKLAKLLAGDYGVQAAVRDVHYNSRLIEAAARERGVTSPLIDAATALFGRAEELGLGSQDMVAVVEALPGPPPGRDERHADAVSGRITPGPTPGR